MIRKIKDESGNAVIESTFVVTTVMMVICVLLFFGFIFYQQTAIQAIANDTAVKIAATYSYECKDMDMGFISVGNKKDIKGISSPNLYYSLIRGNKESDAVKKAKWYAGAKMNQFRLLKNDQSTKVDVKIRDCKESIFRRECVVTVEESYAPPILKLLLPNNKIKFSSSGSAVITDYLDYYSTVTFINNLHETINSKTGLSETAGQAISLADRVVDIFNSLKDYATGKTDDKEESEE